MKRLLIACALPWAAGPAAAALTRIGTAAAVAGKVNAVAPAPEKVGRIVESGKPLYLNDEVTTDAKGRLQILLLDETVFTLGPNSAMTLDEFVYDPATGAGAVSASIAKGVFRFVTGKVARADPKQMKVKLPSGTMGIRGTIVAGQVNPDGSALAVLLGPGAGNNAGERAGAFSLEGSGGEVTVSRPGFGSTVEPGQPPSPPSYIPPAQLDALLGGLGAAAPSDQDSDEGGSSSAGESAQAGSADSAADAGDAGGDGGFGSETDQSATELAGQDVGDAQGDLSETQAIGDLNQDFQETSQTAANDAAEESVIADGTADWDDIRTVQSGTGQYKFDNLAFSLTSCNGSSCSGSQTGELDLLLNIDFGARMVGGNCGGACPASQVRVDASDSVSEISISEIAGFSSVSFETLSGHAVLTGSSANGHFDAEITLKNDNGKAGAQAHVSATYENTSGTVGSGTGSASLIDCSVSSCSGPQ